MKKLLIITCLFTSSCNSITKNWGGTSTITLPKNQKLINITWKDDNLWYLTKPMSVVDTPETYYFQEKSNLNILTGTVIVKECIEK